MSSDVAGAAVAKRFCPAVGKSDGGALNASGHFGFLAHQIVICAERLVASVGILDIPFKLPTEAIDSYTMDIDDILREVDPTSHTIPPETRDLQALTRAWVAERSAPELLE